MIAIQWVGHPRSWDKGRDYHSASLVIIHNTEGHEGPGAARAGHEYDVVRTDGVSTHLFVDSMEAVQEVEYPNTAHAAFFHGNAYGVQIELCHAGVWDLTEPIDAVTFDNGAQAAAQVCKALGIPAVWLNATQARAAWFSGGKGITGHYEITTGWPEDGGDHTDPGTTFPRAEFARRVAAYVGGGAMTTEETEVTVAKLSGFPGQPDWTQGAVHVGDNSPQGYHVAKRQAWPGLVWPNAPTLTPANTYATATYDRGNDGILYQLFGNAPEPATGAAGPTAEEIADAVIAEIAS